MPKNKVSILAVLHLWPTQPFAMPFLVIRCAACWHQLATLLQDPAWWAPWDQAGACATKDAWKTLRDVESMATWCHMIHMFIPGNNRLICAMLGILHAIPGIGRMSKSQRACGTKRIHSSNTSWTLPDCQTSDAFQDKVCMATCRVNPLKPW